MPGDVCILGIDAYTAVCFDPNTHQASVSGQGGVTLIGEGGSQRFESGSTVPFEAFKSSSREVVETFDPGQQVSGYAFAGTEAEGEGPLAELEAAISNNTSMTGNEKIDLLAMLHTLGDEASSETEDHLVDLVLELRQALREAKRFDLADRARDALQESGFEVQDHPEGARWTRQ